ISSPQYPVLVLIGNKIKRTLPPQVTQNITSIYLSTGTHNQQTIGMTTDHFLYNKEVRSKLGTCMLQISVVEMACPLVVSTESWDHGANDRAVSVGCNNISNPCNLYFTPYPEKKEGL